MDLLSDILSQMRLTGTLYFRTSFTSPWGVQVPSYLSVARFHFAWKGRCLVRIDGVCRPVHLEQGDLLIITRGAAHRLYCDPTTEDQALPIEQVIEKSGFTGKGALIYGEPGTDAETQLVCGHFAFDPEASHPLIDALPSHIHIRNYGETAGNWMESTLRVIGLEAGNEKYGGDLIALKLSEIIFAQALRTYMANDGADKPILTAFADPVVSKTLAVMHENPSHPWTLEEMATEAGVSRTLLAARFMASMSMSPFAYLTHWRMQLARQALAETPVAIIDVAESVGYQSEAAFGRVFKKQFGVPPATFRRRLAASAAST